MYPAHGQWHKLCCTVCVMTYPPSRISSEQRAAVQPNRANFQTISKWRVFTAAWRHYCWHSQLYLETKSEIGGQRSEVGMEAALAFQELTCFLQRIRYCNVFAVFFFILTTEYWLLTSGFRLQAFSDAALKIQKKFSTTVKILKPPVEQCVFMYKFKIFLTQRGYRAHFPPNTGTNLCCN